MREVFPIWATQVYRGREYECAEGCAYGFIEGVKLCVADWKPLLQSDDGKAWYRPIGLLGEEDFGPEQDRLTSTPAKREKLTHQIPASVLAMHAHWLPLRQAIHEREMAKAMQPKTGRNDPRPRALAPVFVALESGVRAIAS